MTDNEIGLIDSNILVYAHDVDNKTKYSKAKSFVAHKYITKTAIVSAQNLAEFYRAITEKISKKVNKEMAKQAVRDCTNILQVVSYDHKILLEAIDIAQIYDVPFWDALIAATMQENQIDVIYTENGKDFKKIPWLKVINPLK